MSEEPILPAGDKSDSRGLPHWARGLIVLVALAVVVLNGKRLVPLFSPPTAQVSGLGADRGGLVSPFRVWGSVRNVGRSGHIVLEATVTQGNGRVIVKTQELSLNAGEVKTFEFKFENVSTMFGEVSYFVRGKR